VLRVERTALESRSRELDVVDVEALRARIEARLADLGRHLAEDGRHALRALLRGERLRVSPDPERVFRVDGGPGCDCRPETRTPGDLSPPGVPFEW